MSEKNKLTATDKKVVEENDSTYLLNKGAELYNKGEYEKAVEYYRLAATMGEEQAVTNLGYCYLYGRGIEANLDLAIAYFTIGANNCNVESLYKLGDIYGSDKWNLKDKELSNYYYKKAVTMLTDRDWEGVSIVYERVLQDFPSLAYAVARETFIDGSMPTNLETSYQFLNHAKLGYEKAIRNGETIYQANYEKVVEMLENSAYDEIREEYDWMFEEEFAPPKYDEEDDEELPF